MSLIFNQPRTDESRSSNSLRCIHRVSSARCISGRSLWWNSSRRDRRNSRTNCHRACTRISRSDASCRTSSPTPLEFVPTSDERDRPLGWIWRTYRRRTISSVHHPHPGHTVDRCRECCRYAWFDIEEIEWTSPEETNAERTIVVCCRHIPRDRAYIRFPSIHARKRWTRVWNW